MDFAFFRVKEKLKFVERKTYKSRRLQGRLREIEKEKQKGEIKKSMYFYV